MGEFVWLQGSKTMQTSVIECCFLLSKKQNAYLLALVELHEHFFWGWDGNSGIKYVRTESLYLLPFIFFFQGELSGAIKRIYFKVTRLGSRSRELI